MLLSVIAHAGFLYWMANLNAGVGNGVQPVVTASLQPARASPEDAQPSDSATDVPPAPVKNDDVAIVGEKTIEQFKGNHENIVSLFEDNAPHYFRLDELTKIPRTLIDIPSDLSFAAFEGLPQRAVLRLFINENGNVDRVSIDGPELPEQVQNMLKSAFLDVIFDPGERNGVRVKSQIRIEVSLNDSMNNNSDGR